MHEKITQTSHNGRSHL